MVFNKKVLKEFRYLLKGYWDKELPDFFQFPDDSHIKRFVNLIHSNDGLDFFKTEIDLFSGYIKDFNDFRIYDDNAKGLETIFYYSYKNSNAMRQMGIQNIFQYMGFVYNAIEYQKPFFMDHYLTSSFYDRSVSPVFISDSYLIEDEFYGLEVTKEYKYLVDYYSFKTKDKKVATTEDSYLYALHVDISNFYPNIYSHYLSRIGKSLNTFGTQGDPFLECYFVFLDRYNQVSNMSETKGITTGPFSSTVCAELLMCEIDKRICEKILQNSDIGYVRNVDDMTFYSDSKEELERVLSDVQILFSNYKLMINETKTSIRTCAFEYEEDKINQINQASSSLFDDKTLCFANLDSYKAIINELLLKDEKSIVKSILSKTKRMVEDAEEINDIDSDRAIFFFAKLGLSEKYLGSRCFKIIERILSMIGTESRESILESLFKKRKIIDKYYYDSVIQIWFYYIFMKYGSEQQKTELIDGYKNLNQKKNPIVLATLIRKGNNNNKDVFIMIYNEFGNKVSNLMLSRFFLPLILLYSVDKYNYYNYISVVPRIFKELYI